MTIIVSVTVITCVENIMRKKHLWLIQSIVWSLHHCLVCSNVHSLIIIL